jgi:replicative DNA helicase
VAGTRRPTTGTNSRASGGGDVPEGRVPPHDLDAERAVLCALLIDNHKLREVATEVRADDFYHPSHQTLYKAVLALHEDQKPVDLITLSEYLNSRKLLDSLGGPVFLAEIADFESTAANAVHYAQIVRGKAVKRALIGCATEIVEEGFADGPPDQLLDFAESKIFDLSKQRARSTFTRLHDQMEPTFEYIDKIMERAGGLTGLPTGFKFFDEMTGGLQPGELIILAARPAMGKTALALNMARNSAVYPEQRKVAVFSLEMTTQALVLRLLSSEAEVDFSKFRSSYLPTRDYKRLTQAGDKLSHADIWIDDSGDMSVLEIKSKCRRLKAEKGLDLVLVDYLQLVHGDAGRRERKDLEIAEISRGLKALAKELHIPVIALSQLNRGPEQRDPDKRRPILGDLRESGAIEQDADVIAFIYRDYVYNKDADPEAAELIIEKQRNGPTGTVKLRFKGRFARFEDWGEDGGSGSGGPAGPEPAAAVDPWDDSAAEPPF